MAQDNKKLVIRTSVAYAIGDIHGMFDTLLYHIRRCDMKDCAIVACGDIGLGFATEKGSQDELKRVNKKLKECSITLLLFRGNHDDPAYFNRPVSFVNLSNVIILPDYALVTFVNCDDERETLNVLCVGGGISVDRISRKRRMTVAAKQYQIYTGCTYETAVAKIRHEYWENENIIFDENQLSQLPDSKEVPIQCVCTHTCPSFTYPLTKDGIASFLALDKNLSTDLDTERGNVDKLYHWLKEHNHPVENWCYGHFHIHNTEEVEGTVFHLIDMVRPEGIDFYRLFGY